jgi:hypothetical protein
VAEQWRVVVVIDGAKRSELWRCEHDLDRQLRDRTGGAVILAGVPSSALNARLLARHARQQPVCAYAGNRAAAEAAAQVAREVAGQHRLIARVTVECWRPVQKQWVDASTVSAGSLAEERDYQQRDDRRLSAETGIAQWQVRADMRTHRDTVAVAQRLTSDGHQVEQHWKYVVAWADSQDDARRLAEVIKQLAPSGAEVLPHRLGDPDYYQGGSVSAWW